MDCPKRSENGALLCCSVMRAETWALMALTASIKHCDRHDASKAMQHSTCESSWRKTCVWSRWGWKGSNRRDSYALECGAGQAVLVSQERLPRGLDRTQTVATRRTNWAPKRSRTFAQPALDSSETHPQSSWRWWRRLLIGTSNDRDVCRRCHHSAKKGNSGQDWTRDVM